VFLLSSLEYVVQRRILPASDFTDIGTVNGYTTSYTDNSIFIRGLGDLTEYRIRTRVIYGSNSVLSVPSNVLDCRTGPKKISGTETGTPVLTRLVGNHPNPFNPGTTIRFELAEQGNVSLTVFDVLGREIASLVNENLREGRYERTFDASRLASGVYYYRLTTAKAVQTKKLLLAK
jgi:hypothetical protein